MEQHQNLCIGIDLGTTNSEVACIQNGTPVVIRVDGSKIIPSVVSLDLQGNILVGNPAVNNELTAPEDTIRWIKRKMGREELIPLGGKVYTPQMISSLILSRLKQAAEEFLGQAVTRAVITVPAFFNEKQREATREAAALAGLEPLKLLNEPTAAALAYATGGQRVERCLVYDLGGGTFDVSIVDFSENLMEVRGSHGDTELGGADFDKLIAEKARSSFLAQHQIDLSKNPSSWSRLLRASEAAKIRLSTEPLALIKEEFIASANNEPLHLNFEISRTEFEEMISPAIERSLVSIRRTLEMASLSANDLDRVILVGGSTYIPLVAEMIEKELQITPQASINPSTVVAMGAAIEAAILSGGQVGPTMIDVTPHSLGVACVNIYHELEVVPLIRRNSPIPMMASHMFYKLHDDQEKICVDVYQGESSLPSQNQHLGKFNLDQLGESKNQEVHVKFELDRSGLLHVTITDMGSNKKVARTLKRVSSSRVKHVNLADLESVRLAPIETLHLDVNEDDFGEGSDSLDWGNVGDNSEYEIISLAQEKILSEVSEELERLLSKAYFMVGSGKLQPKDLSELSGELALVEAGDTAAAARLSDLIYYLE